MAVTRTSRSALRRVIAALLLVLSALGGARQPLAVAPAPPRLNRPAMLATPDEREPLRPFRGASRDRSLHGKARVRARRALT